MENAFEILASRFLLLQSTRKQVAVVCVMTVCAFLHNLLTQSGRRHFQPENMSLNFNGSCKGIIFSMKAKTPVNLPKHMVVCLPTTS